MAKKIILLIGPNIGDKNNFYGGGIGGYTRNMALYLRDFQFREFSIVPFFCSARRKKELKLLSFPARFLKDVFGLIFKIIFNKIDAIHILGQYRNALPREVAWVVISKLFKIAIVYEIKAGMFIVASKKNKVHKWLSNFILKKSDLILVEGKTYLDYVYKESLKKAIYFPNVVSNSEITKPKEIILEEPLKILFVGYCYEGKGIFEAVKAIHSERLNVNIELEIIGAESEDFSTWMDSISENPRVKIMRYGAKNHEFVLDKMKANTIYLYPSKHSGEGHNNTINEAMMNSMVIISSKAGFLEDVLTNCGYLIESDDSLVEKIVYTILEILKNPQIAVQKAQNGRNKIENIFNSETQGKILEEQYKKIFNSP
ncbi:MAG: glycosyltransferase family 4 protein [Flavobacteriaceae bacterium]|nr:glycosyltransferase family 4 protein [Flavobacteriaceae bacterium]